MPEGSGAKSSDLNGESVVVVEEDLLVVVVLADQFIRTSFSFFFWKLYWRCVECTSCIWPT